MILDFEWFMNKSYKYVIVMTKFLRILDPLQTAEIIQCWNVRLYVVVVLRSRPSTVFFSNHRVPQLLSNFYIWLVCAQQYWPSTTSTISDQNRPKFACVDFLAFLSKMFLLCDHQTGFTGKSEALSSVCKSWPLLTYFQAFLTPNKVIIGQLWER